jgi:hypothetical protein
VKQIKYTGHLKLRLGLRKIPEEYPEIIYRSPEQTYYDTAEDTFIAIKNLPYNKKVRPMMIAYEEKKGIVEIITIHPITEEKIINRTMRGRWVKP